MSYREKSKKTIRVSVVVTTHNYASYLGQCIDSILKQIHKPDEIIVVNDASTDETDSVMEKYARNTIIHYFEVTFANPQKTRNFALEKVSYQSVLFVDADDYLQEDYLKETIEILSAKPQVAMVYTDHTVVDHNGAYQSQSHACAYSYEHLQRRNYITMCALIRDARMLRFDERLQRFQDWDAWLTYLKGKRAWYLPRALYCRREHDQSLSTQKELYLAKLKLFVKHEILTCEINESCEKNIKDIALASNKMLVASIAADEDIIAKMNSVHYLSASSYDSLFKIIRKKLASFRNMNYFVIIAEDLTSLCLPKRGAVCVTKERKPLNQIVAWNEIEELIFTREGIQLFLNSNNTLYSICRKIIFSLRTSLYRLLYTIKIL